MVMINAEFKTLILLQQTLSQQTKDVAGDRQRPAPVVAC